MNEMINLTARLTAECSLKNPVFKILIPCAESSVLHNVTKRRIA